MKKQFVSVAFLVAMFILTQTPIPNVKATDTSLNIISGSNVDTTVFEYQEHILAKGFAASISADLPIGNDRMVLLKFGCAVASLGEEWTLLHFILERGISLQFIFLRSWALELGIIGKSSLSV